MKIIDCSPFRDEEGRLSLLQMLNGMLEYGPRWRSRVQAADQAIKRLQRTLGKEFTLFRDFSIPGIDASQCAMLLVGPQGILALLANPLKGIYRAKGSEWMAFDQRSRKFKKTRPNYQELIQAISTVLKKALEQEGLPLVDIENVLIFTNPRTLIDTARPRVRVVPADAVDYFAANLLQLPVLLDKEDLSYLSEILLRLAKPSPEEEEPEADWAAPDEESVSLMDHVNAMKFPHSDYETRLDGDAFPDSIEEAVEPEASTRFHFKRKQWLVLGFLFILEILILGLFALLVFAGEGLAF